MTAKETLQYLIQDAGLDEATAAAVMKAAENDKVNARALTLKQQADYDKVLAKTQELETSFAKAKNYEDWYAKYGEAVQKNNVLLAKYTERYGSLDEPVVQTTTATKTFTPEEVQKIVETRVGATEGRMSELLKSSGKILERHLRNKREKEIDWEKLADLAGKKNGDLVSAYDEYDKPEKEAADKVAEEARIESRVRERLTAERSKFNFPPGADATPTSDFGLSKERPKTDASERRARLLQTAATGKYEPNSDAA